MIIGLINGGDWYAKDAVATVVEFFQKNAVLEKEDDVGWGICCRNSGVIHAGFNYKPGTLRAQLCVEGNRSFAKLCQEIDVPYKKIGKVVVAQKKKRSGD